jgi:hypothetical protein
MGMQLGIQWVIVGQVPSSFALLVKFDGSIF